MTAPSILSTVQVAKILARADAATDGPWTETKPEKDGDGWQKGVVVCATAPGPSNRVYASPSGGSYPGDDVRFIASARTDVPALCASHEALRAAVERLAAEHDHRTCELLEANNREVERRRAAERKVARLEMIVSAAKQRVGEIKALCVQFDGDPHVRAPEDLLREIEHIAYSTHVFGWRTRPIFAGYRHPRPRTRGAGTMSADTSVSTEEDIHREDDDDDDDELCGRWDNGSLSPRCAMAGTEWCDWFCGLREAR